MKTSTSNINMKSKFEIANQSSYELLNHLLTIYLSFSLLISLNATKEPMMAGRKMRKLL